MLSRMCLRSRYLYFTLSSTSIYYCPQRRPRCHYCRKGISCPWLECAVCSNRVIVPVAFRTARDRQSYTCPACSNPQRTNNSIVEEESTARTLIAQNGVEWLGYPDKKIFDGKSAFKLVQAFGYTVFSDAPSNKSPAIVLNNKRARDTSQIISQVEDRVGRGEIVLSTCALCFEEMPRAKLAPACGRTGCSQLVDEDCLREWVRTSPPFIHDPMLNTRDAIFSTGRTSPVTSST